MLTAPARGVFFMKTRRHPPTLTIAIPSFVYTLSDEIARRLPDRYVLTRTVARLKMRFPKVPWKKYLPITLLILIVIVTLSLAGKGVYQTMTNKDDRIVVSNALATMQVNKELTIPVKDAKGVELTKLHYFIDSAELRNEIIVKGKRAIAVKGRKFLILTIKVVNDFDRPIDISAKDYVRLSVNDNEKELLAADIHNDPVSIQPISTKFTRIGFPINDTDKNLTLFVGEIKNTNKEKIALAFH